MRAKLLYMKKLFFLAGTVIIMVACNQPTGKTETTTTFSLDSVKAAIAASNNSMNEAVEKGDSTLFVSGYASDGCVMPDGGGPKMCGAAGLNKFFGMVRQMGVTSIKLATTEVTGGKELVAEEGTYELLVGGKAVDKGKYIVTWKPENGVWKKHRDIWNSEMPPAPMDPAKK